MYDLHVNGWHLRSALPLPALPPWPDPAGAPDILLRLGPVPPLTDPVYRTPFLSIDSAGRCRIEVAAIGALRVEEGRVLTLQPAEPADVGGMQHLLLKNGLSLLAHQRGLMPMAMSCAVIRGRVIAIAGSPASGKSTLAAALLQAGHRLLADGVTVLDWQQGRVMARPGAPGLTLWSDSLTALGLSAGPPIRDHIRPAKREWQVPGLFQPAALPLALVLHLDKPGHQASSAALTPYAGLRAANGLLDSVHRYQAGQALRGATELLRLCAALAQQVPQVSLPRATGFADLGPMAADLPDALEPFL